jgi:hypothetical protein
LVISHTLCEEGEVFEVIDRRNNTRDIRLGEEVFQSRLDVATCVDLVVGELLTSGSADDIFAGVLGGRGGSRSPLPLVTKVASLV